MTQPPVTLNLPGLPRWVQVLLLSPFALVVLAAARLIVIADYDTSTAVAMAGAGGVVGTLVGSIVPLLPPLLPIVTVFLLARRVWSFCVLGVILTAFLAPVYADPLESLWATWHTIHQSWQWVWMGEWASIWHASPLPVIVFGICIFLLVSWLGQLPLYANLLDEHARRVMRTLEFLRRLFVGLMVAILATVSFIFMQNVYRVPLDPAYFVEAVRTPWRPAEILKQKSGGKTVGYTMATNDGWFTILREDTRSILYVKADDVESRSVCVNDSRRPPSPLIHMGPSREAPRTICPSETFLFAIRR